ncbi:hypothetical protein B0H13DRAFT_1850811 [Mycena leptocephala]|nr:hypothetical protein B0H13DRAFT_1850811 [Mycena leptocephala]
MSITFPCKKYTLKLDIQRVQTNKFRVYEGHSRVSGIIQSWCVASGVQAIQAMKFLRVQKMTTRLCRAAYAYKDLEQLDSTESLNYQSISVPSLGPKGAACSHPVCTGKVANPNPNKAATARKSGWTMAREHRNSSMTDERAASIARDSGRGAGDDNEAVERASVAAKLGSFRQLSGLLQHIGKTEWLGGLTADFVIRDDGGRRNSFNWLASGARDRVQQERNRVAGVADDGLWMR